jgi:hypothetical protein
MLVNSNRFVGFSKSGASGASQIVRRLMDSGFAYVRDSEHHRIACKDFGFVSAVVQAASEETDSPTHVFQMNSGFLYVAGYWHIDKPTTKPGQWHSGIHNFVKGASARGYAYRSMADIVQMATGRHNLIARPYVDGRCSSRVTRSIYQIVYESGFDDFHLFEVDSGYGKRLLLTDRYPLAYAHAYCAAK